MRLGSVLLALLCALSCCRAYFFPPCVFPHVRACSCLALSTRSHGGLELPTVRLASSSQTPKHKVLLFFGEHARELISPEVSCIIDDELLADPSLNTWFARSLR